MAVGQAMLVAEEGLSSQIDALMGSGVLLDAPKLKELVSYIEWVALPAAEAYERLLSEATSLPWRL